MLGPERAQAAARRIERFIRRTPVIEIEPGLHLKLECLQPTGSFKVRGFFAEALLLEPEQLHRGLLTVSAGNAAQACAYVAHQLGVRCRTFMFETAPRPKIAGVERWGATPVLLPRQALLDWMGREGWRAEPETFIHPFAGDDLMSGYAALGLEVLEQVPDLERIVVPVGGGGLIAGIAQGLKAVRPGVDVVGVQSSGYAMWPRVIETGGPVAMSPATIADGTTGPYTEKMHRLLAQLIDRWVIVPEEHLLEAIGDLAMRAKIIAEGAGALAYAAARQLPDRRSTVALVSGGNVAPDVLARALADRSL